MQSNRSAEVGNLIFARRKKVHEPSPSMLTHFAASKQCLLGRLVNSSSRTSGPMQQASPITVCAPVHAIHYPERSELQVARQIAAGHQRQHLAESVSTRRRQEADFRRDGPANQSRLAATPGETRYRPAAVLQDENPNDGNGLIAVVQIWGSNVGSCRNLTFNGSCRGCPLHSEAVVHRQLVR